VSQVKGQVQGVYCLTCNDRLLIPFGFDSDATPLATASPGFYFRVTKPTPGARKWEHRSPEGEWHLAELRDYLLHESHMEAMGYQRTKTLGEVDTDWADLATRISKECSLQTQVVAFGVMTLLKSKLESQKKGEKEWAPE
jgi:hypothetical protein